MGLRRFPEWIARDAVGDWDAEDSDLPGSFAARRHAVAKAQLLSVSQQLGDLRGRIDNQVRSALLDVQAAQQLVQVARSNVDLASQALSDETDRFNNGIDDTLPLVQAQATLQSAQSNLVESLYQFNLAKLGLARSAGVIELQYKAYLGR